MVSGGNFVGWVGVVSVVSMSETIVIGEQAYYNCVKVVTEISGTGYNYRDLVEATPEENGFVTGTREIWFAEGVGIVKVVYSHGNGSTTTIDLVSYDVTAGSNLQNYMPLMDGNTWTYEWTNINGGYDGISIQETWSVGIQPPVP